MELDKLLKEFERLRYPSFGFGMLLMNRMTGKDSRWSAGLRNPQKWKRKNSFEGKTLEIALNKLYKHCKYL